MQAEKCFSIPDTLRPGNLSLVFFPQEGFSPDLFLHHLASLYRKGLLPPRLLLHQPVANYQTITNQFLHQVFTPALTTQKKHQVFTVLQLKDFTRTVGLTQAHILIWRSLNLSQCVHDCTIVKQADVFGETCYGSALSASEVWGSAPAKIDSFLRVLFPLFQELMAPKMQTSLSGNESLPPKHRDN